MDPLERITAAEAIQIDGLLFDLDDTLLQGGRLGEAAYSALFRLRDCGIRLVALTGRPGSWGELIARMWPVEAAIAENGAMAYARKGEKVVVRDTVTSQHRAEHRAKLEDLVVRMKREVPTVPAADDASGRITDYTFDVGEHHSATEEDIQRMRQLASSYGARTTRSSVHLHVTYDQSDKATGALSFLGSLGVDATLARSKFAFIGDSENDAPCFSAFRTTVGVSNLRGRFSLTPRFRTGGCGAEGFRQFADVLCRFRS